MRQVVMVTAGLGALLLVVSAKAETRPGARDLLLIPASQGEEQDSVYLRELCHFVANRPALAGRYRNIYFGGQLRLRVSAALTELATLRQQLLNGTESTRASAVRRLRPQPAGGLLPVGRPRRPGGLSAVAVARRRHGPIAGSVPPGRLRAMKP